jgi:hypothetical protein
MSTSLIVNTQDDSEQTGSAFLLSLADMFNSGAGDASENVHALVIDFISNKHRTKPAGSRIGGDGNGRNYDYTSPGANGEIKRVGR